MFLHLILHTPRVGEGGTASCAPLICMCKSRCGRRPTRRPNRLHRKMCIQYVKIACKVQFACILCASEGVHTQCGMAACKVRFACIDIGIPSCGASAVRLAVQSGKRVGQVGCRRRARCALGCPLARLPTLREVQVFYYELLARTLTLSLSV